MKHLFLLILFGTFSIFAYGQVKDINLEATKPDIQTPIEEAKPVEEIKPVEDAKLVEDINKMELLNQELRLDAEVMKRTLKKDITIEVVDLNQERKALEKSGSIVPPAESAESMIKQLLGDVYAEVGHIPEPQWFEMEPIAEEYVLALFKARTMTDGKAATQFMAEARKIFEAAIDVKLTDQQKAIRTQKRAELKAWEDEKARLYMQAEEQIKQIVEKTASEIGNQKAIKITFQ